LGLYVWSVARHIVVSGGGGFWTDGGMTLDTYALQLAGKVRPRVCYLATASGDAQNYIDGFYEALGSAADACHLTLFRQPEQPPQEILGQADVILVGAGSTANLLAVWQVHGIGTLLRDAWERGAVLCGASAGGLCWFDSGMTDSLSFDGTMRPLQGGLGFVSGSYCAHYDADPDRRRRYRQLVADGTLAGGYGIDEFAAAHFVDDHLHAVVAAQPDATAYRVVRSGSTTVETPLVARRIT
jgi:dipeptidase E